MQRVLASVWRHRTTGERLGTLAALAVVGLALASVLVSRSDPDTSLDRALSQAPTTPACDHVDLAKRRSGRITCRSATKTLTMADDDTPVLLGDTDVKVYRARVQRGRLVMRLRVRNHTRTARRPNDRRRQFYLNLPPGHVRARPLAGGSAIGAGEASTLDLRFDLSAGGLRQLRRRKGIVGLGVVPFSQLDAATPRRLGVIRLHTEARHPAPKPAAAPQGAGIPACADVTSAQRNAGRVTCQTATAALTMADMSKPVLFDEVSVRAYQARLTGGAVFVRVRAHNTTDHVEIVHPTDRLFYLNLRPQRLYPKLDKHVIEPRTSETVDMSFPLDAAAAERLRRRGGIVGLGVVPFGELDDSPPSRVGVIRLRVQLS